MRRSGGSLDAEKWLDIRVGPSRCGAQCKTRRGAPLSSGVITSSCSVNRDYDRFVEDILAQYLYEYHKRRQDVGVDLYVGYMITVSFMESERGGH